MALVLTEKFQNALQHSVWGVDGRRRGASTDHAARLLNITSLVLQDRGDEDEAIAAALHIAFVNGCRGVQLDFIGAEYGPRVAAIVAACGRPETGGDGEGTDDWWARVGAYLGRLRAVECEHAESVGRVLVAESLHDLRATLREAHASNDGRAPSSARTTDPSVRLAYYDALVAVYVDLVERSATLDELSRLIRELRTEMTPGQIDEAAWFEYELVVTAKQSPDAEAAHAFPMISGPSDILTDSGQPLDATFTVFERADGQVELIYESSGGRAGGPNPRNLDYRSALELILGRLGRTDWELTEVRVESQQTAKLSVDHRHVQLDDHQLPLRVAAVRDLTDLRKDISRSARRVGTKNTQSPGGSSRRLALVLRMQNGLHLP